MKLKKSNDKPKEEIKDVKNIIKINLGQLGNTGGVGLTFERMINSNVSASMGISGKFSSISVGENGFLTGYQKTSGLGFMPEVRFYALPNYNAPRGLYLGAFYNYYNEKYEVKNYDFNNDEVLGSVSSSFNSVGATIGWMFRIKSSFVIDLQLGPVFQSIDSPTFFDIKSSNGTVFNKEKSPNTTKTELTGAFLFSLGYAF